MKNSSKMYLIQCLMKLSESVYRDSEEGYKKDFKRVGNLIETSKKFTL